MIATSSGMAAFYAGCAAAEEMEICRHEGVGKVKGLEVRTLWPQQVVKARMLMLKTVKSVANCADLETKM